MLPSASTSFHFTNFFTESERKEVCSILLHSKTAISRKFFYQVWKNDSTLTLNKLVKNYDTNCSLIFLHYWYSKLKIRFSLVTHESKWVSLLCYILLGNRKLRRSEIVNVKILFFLEVSWKLEFVEATWNISDLKSPSKDEKNSNFTHFSMAPNGTLP